MKAKELLDAGHLAAAVQQLNEDVKAHPADARLRTFLFELLCFSGDHERALRQLDVIGHQSTAADVGVQIYRNILAAEAARRRFLAEGAHPVFLLEPPPYARLHLEAARLIGANDAAAAKALLDESERARPRPRGRADGKPFSDFRDTDDLVGPFLEVIFQDRYVWIPFERIRRLRIPPPKRLRDLIWILATLETDTQGVGGEIFLPVLYLGSSEHPDENVKLGRMTDWKSSAGGPSLGGGQRLFLVDGEDRAMLEVREVEFEPRGSVD